MNASLVEWIWTLTALGGALLSVVALRSAYGDLRTWGTTANGGRLLLNGYVRREALRLLIQATWLVIGVLALNDGRQAAFNPVALLLTGTNVTVAVNTALDLRDGRRLRGILNLVDT